MGDVAVHGLKFAGIMLCSIIFSAALFAIVNFLVAIIFPDVFIEVIGLISVFVPFDAFIVFNAMSAACTMIMGFIIACKVFNLNVKVIGSA